MLKKKPYGGSVSVKGRVAGHGKVTLRARAAGADPDDAPELDSAFFDRAEIRQGDKVVKRGRPKSDNPKEAIKLRIDADVIERYRATGAGWQTKMNDVLREHAPRVRRKAG